MAPRNRERIEVYEKIREGQKAPVSGRGQSVTLIRTIRVSEHGTSAIVEKCRAHKIAQSIARPKRANGATRAALSIATHPDYSKPLVVEFLCPRCHQARAQGDEPPASRPRRWRLILEDGTVIPPTALAMGA